MHPRNKDQKFRSFTDFTEMQYTIFRHAHFGFVLLTNKHLPLRQNERMQNSLSFVQNVKFTILKIGYKKTKC